MCFRFLFCISLFCWRACSASTEVIQSPRYLVKGKEQKAMMNCVPMKSHVHVYWYHQKLHGELKFLVYLQSEDIIDKTETYVEKFLAKCPKNLPCSLEIKSAEAEDSASYFCASSRNSGLNTEVFFGAGTRLTVLEDLKKVRLPNVAIFEPSEAEINHTQKATLVCLARDFYPDHVELTWWVNGKEVHSGVITDPEPYQKDPSQKDSSYYLSSRLRVSAAFWHNARNHFRCQVQFYGISEDDTWEDARRPKPVTQNISAGLWGRADCGLTSESYHQGVMSATLLYEVLLGKAALYAVLVSGLVLMAMVKRKDC